MNKIQELLFEMNKCQQMASIVNTDNKSSMFYFNADR